jgi:hypothetical protein
MEYLTGCSPHGHWPVSPARLKEARMYHSIVARKVSATLPDGSAYENIFMQNMRMRWGRITEIHTLEDTAVLQGALDRLADNGVAKAHATRGLR